MAITTIQGLKDGLRGTRAVTKNSGTAEGAGTFHSYWKSVGATSPVGSTPPAYTAGSGYTCTSGTTGALPFPIGSDGSYIASLSSCVSSTSTHPFLCDRLWACSGFSSDSILLQSITTPGTIPARDVDATTTGAGVLLFAEIYTATGPTGATWTVSYTNQAGASGRLATYTHPNEETVGQLCPFTLQSGDTGVRAVASFQASIASGTAGDVGLTLLRPIIDMPIRSIAAGLNQNAYTCAFQKIIPSSCLMFMGHCTTTNFGIVTLSARTAQG